MNALVIMEEADYDVRGLKAEEKKYKDKYFKKQTALDFIAYEGSESDSDYGQEVLKMLEKDG